MAYADIMFSQCDVLCKEPYPVSTRKAVHIANRQLSPSQRAALLLQHASNKPFENVLRHRHEVVLSTKSCFVWKTCNRTAKDGAWLERSFSAAFYDMLHCRPFLCHKSTKVLYQCHVSLAVSVAGSSMHGC
jgi:hypothetical protein